jgi:hypothetical protein
MYDGDGLVFDGGADGDSGDFLHFGLLVWFGLGKAVLRLARDGLE